MAARLRWERPGCCCPSSPAEGTVRVKHTLSSARAPAPCRPAPAAVSGRTGAPSPRSSPSFCTTHFLEEMPFLDASGPSSSFHCRVTIVITTVSGDFSLLRHRPLSKPTLCSLSSFHCSSPNSHSFECSPAIRNLSPDSC